MTAVATIGHNNPPTPFDEISSRIEGLYEEAKGWLDGDPVETQGQADELNKLINMIREAAKDADALRKEEVAPFDEGKAKVQARYAPLIAGTKSVKGKTVLALDVAKKALTPWLEKLDAEKREAERKAREEAEAKRKAAEQAFALSESDDLTAREDAEALLAAAKETETEAARAAKAKAHAKGGSGRATGLRSFWIPEITDPREFARWVWVNRKSEMDAFLADLAKKIVQQNHNQTIPGLKINEERKAV